MSKSLSNFVRWIPAILVGLLALEYFSLGSVWITLLALALFALYSAFSPKQGLIGQIQLPRDDGFLDTQDVQWWYWTGHLETEEGRRFGFEVVFFAFRNFGLFWDQLAQGAITDVEGNRFHFSEYVHFGLQSHPKDSFNLKAGPGDLLRAAGGGGKDHLHSEIDGFVLDLDLEQTKKPVMHYCGGPHPYYFGGYTYYYSRVNMATSGTLTFGGKTYKVSGSSWFDRQYGDLLEAITQGWQWFAIELDDNRQIMIYDLLGKGAGVERAGSITNADGHTRNLTGNDFKIEQLGKWQSPQTGCIYPMGWRVSVAGLTLTVEPMVVDQELCAEHDLWIGPEYWEGACSVSGDVAGKAYVELNGFCRGPEGTIDFRETAGQAKSQKAGN